MIKYSLSCIMIFWFTSVFAQNNDTLNIWNTASFTVSYFGNNLIKPGIKFKMDLLLKERTIIKSRTKRSGKTVDKSKTKQLLAGANIGFYWHPKSHIGAFNFYELTYRAIKLKNNSYSKIGIGPGIYRSFYPQTYEVNDKGDVNKIYFGGRMYFAPVLIFGTGKFFKNSIIKSRTFTTNLMFLFNYNGGVVPLLNLELGFCFDFKKHRK